ncbi:MAG: hypothetical protein ACK5HT_01115 [Draconibacterium sp.]
MSIIIPFLSAYAMNLKGGSPALTGYALGIFGLTQAVLQIPFGALSDRIGYNYVLGPLVHIVLNVSQMFVFSAFLIVGCFIWVLTSTRQVNPALRKEQAEKHKVKSVFNLAHLRKSLLLTFNNLLMMGVFSISSIVPMLINREIDNRQRGKGNGVMVSLQYFGSFLGAAVTGKLWGWGPSVAFAFVGAVIFAGIILINFEKKA